MRRAFLALLPGLLTAALLPARPAAAQQPIDPAAALARYHQHDAYEKLYLHLDRPLYLSGELLWLRVYAVEGTRHRPLPLSQVAYVEVLDARQRPVLQTKVALRAAAGSASLQLPATLPSGRYTVRAYTRWMRNFDADYFHHATITVVNTFTPGGATAGLDSAAARPPDVQFFPEGGQLVQHLPGRLGFKVTGSDGRGLAAEGSILDENGQAVARFRTLKFGMGRVEFTPTRAGAAYRAVLQLPGRPAISRPLPAVQAQGYALRLEAAGPARLRLTVAASAAAEGVYLLGHARQQTFVSRRLLLQNGRAELLLDRASLPAGVLHFTAFNEAGLPVAERLYFQRPAALRLQATPDQPRYPDRANVALTLTATDAAGQPRPASLSVAVYRLDTLTASAPAPADISAALWLGSELRGEVESPDYYLRSPEAEAEEAADNLMLSQGWRRFRWTDVLAGTAPARPFAPELHGHLVQGRVLHRGTGTPAPNVTAFLAAPSRFPRLYNDLSRPDGSLQFELKEFYGPSRLVLQSDPHRDSTYRFELLSPFAPPPARTRAAVPLVLSEAYRAVLSQRHLQVQTQSAYFRPLLTPRPPRLADSLAFFGTGDERFRLDDYTRFKTIEDVMREYVPGVLVRQRADGYHFRVLDDIAHASFQGDPLVLLDGVPIFDLNAVMRLDPLLVQRLEVVRGLYFQGPLLYSGIVSYTTYRGDLAGYTPPARALVQDYEGLQWEREFYVPRYAIPADRQSRRADLRHLLYWNPAVTTAADGRRQLHFTTGDEPGRYRVVVQGLTAEGLSGSSSAVFDVQPVQRP